VLAAHGVECAGPESVQALAERAAQALEQERSQGRTRSALEQSKRELERTVAGLFARVERRRKELHEWRASWQEAVRAVPGDPAASPEQVVATLDSLDELFRALERVNSTRQRIEAIERDAREFVRQVAELVAEYAPELAGQPADRAAASLSREHVSTRQTQAVLAAIDGGIADKRAALTTLEIRQQLLESELAALVAGAQLGSLAELREAEQSSERARELDLRLAELSLSLVEDQAGRALEALESEAAGSDLDRVKVRLQELEEELPVQDERHSDAQGRVHSARLGLERFGHSTAVEAEQEAQAIASSVRDDAERWLRLKLASAVLRREIERYRERHQGPVVARGSRLFQRLTRNSFSGLRADVDDSDQPVLVGLRPDGGVVRVDGMSEGTREQLYLALRLASLEHYGEHNELLPLVLDDVLIHSDQERTLAALELLGELGGRMQILLFSHHAHVVELAQKAVPALQLAVHELERPLGAGAQ
jgi:uncharacterized protein YhaN